MPITKEQSEQIKIQLIQQIDSTFPEDKKAEAKSQIENMDEAQLENFLKQNNMIQSQASPGQNQNSPAQISENQKCIFCSIIQGEIPSHQIDENKSAVAVLEINPVSKAHALVIPKEHIESGEKIPSQVFTLAKKIAKKIKTKFKPKDIQITSSNAFGHEILNVLPIYENENLGSERKKADEKDLQEIQKALEKKKKISKPKVKKISQKKSQPKIRIPIRIP